jgi:hypothetical protein
MNVKVLVIAVLALGAAGCNPPPPAEPAASVTVDPHPAVPFGPLSVRIRGTGCTPYAAVPVVVLHYSGWGDVAFPNPSHQASTVAGGGGAWAVDVRVPVGYPGIWEVDPGCGAARQDFEVAPSPDMALAVAPARVRVGERSTVEVSGTNCRGSRVRWHIGQAPRQVIASGEASVAADGSWRGTAEVTAPADRDRHPVAATCFLDVPGPGGAPFVSVDYDQGSLAVDPAAPAT